jgi:hypothetical protein
MMQKGPHCGPFSFKTAAYVHATSAVVYHTRLCCDTRHGYRTMLEINLIISNIKDMQGRVDALRGYL